MQESLHRTCRKHPPELQGKQAPIHGCGLPADVRLVTFSAGKEKYFSRIYFTGKFSSGKLHAEFFFYTSQDQLFNLMVTKHHIIILAYCCLRDELEMSRTSI